MFGLRKLSATAGALALMMSSANANAEAVSPQLGLGAMAPMIELQVAMLSPVFANICLSGAQGCVLPLRGQKPPVGVPPVASAPPPVLAAPTAAAAGGGSFWLIGALAALAGVGAIVAGNGNDSPGG